MGLRLEILLEKDQARLNEVVTGDMRQKELLQEDEDEDFTDENTVNPDGNYCPTALKLAACMLLLEITTYMRETYKTALKNVVNNKTVVKEQNLLGANMGQAIGGNSTVSNKAYITE